MSPTQNELTKIMDIVHSVLNESYVPLRIKDFTLKEDLENDKSLITCQLMLGEENAFLEGQGDGVVDALFCTIINELSSEYSSLNSIQIIDFILKAKPVKRGFGSGGFVNIDLAIRNRLGEKTHFLHEARSLNGAVILVVQKTIEYYVNSELAALQLKKSLRNAKKRNRTDLEEQYINMMSELVKNMPYNKIIKEKE
jgi:hypothetical protein